MGTLRIKAKKTQPVEVESQAKALEVNTLSYWNLSTTYRSRTAEAMTVEQALHSLRDILTTTSDNRPLAIVAGGLRDAIVKGDDE